MKKILLKGGLIVLPTGKFVGDVLIENGKIVKIDTSVSLPLNEKVEEINLDGMILFAGAIDDQVHFREPGMLNKADIYTESHAALAGGITSFMEMPNTVPNTLTQELLEAKYWRASQVSPANYSFYMGTSNDNYDQIMLTDLTKVCGLKIFMGSSTGNMLVDDKQLLEKIFANFPGLIATHCEDEETINENLAEAMRIYGNVLKNIPIAMHPKIRSNGACYKSSSFAVELAKKHSTRLHVLHISTSEETNLFDKNIPLEKKRITAEACLHHMFFTDRDYQKLGTKIKWNPAIKSVFDRNAVLAAVRSGEIDVVATDHAPHTLDEKGNGYASPSGAPLVQHSLPLMYKLHRMGAFSLEEITQKMSYNPAICFGIEDRGEIKEGNYADLVIFDPERPLIVEKQNLLYKCGWSPLEGYLFNGIVHTTIVNGNIAYSYAKGKHEFPTDAKGMRLTFKH